MKIVRAPAPPIPTFKYLNDIVTILGATKLAFYPFLATKGTDVFPYGTGNDGLVGLASDENGEVAIEAEFDPIPLVGGIQALYFDSSTNNHISVADNAAYSHGNATVDTAVSMGAWIYPTEAIGTARTILAKYGSTANQEEYDLRFDTGGDPVLELHDLSASTSETATGGTATVVPWAWNLIVATYDGAQAAPDIHLYRNTTDTNAAGGSTESGAYVAMEDGTAGFLIGARDATGTPAQEFEGYMALPFITGKELTAAEVSSLYTIGQKLIGLA